jgi:curved DNA-binding protein CbpA
MAERSFYDILEVSNTASSDTIDAAYERLAAKFDPALEANAGNAAVRLQYDAIRQAYLALNEADKRREYDRKLALRTFTPVRPIEVLEPFWTVPKMLIAGIIVLGIAGFYVKHQREQSRLEAEKVIAVAKAREAEAKARAEAETERLAMLRENERVRAERYEAARLRSERDADVNNFQRENRVNEITNRVYSSIDRAQAQGEVSVKRAEEMRVKREEAQATAAARQQLARDKAELCRIERERYGRALSC